MNETEEVRTLPAEVQPWARAGRFAVKLLAAAALAVTPAITAYRSAAGDAEVRTQAVKDKAEAGYQLTKPRLEELERRFAALEAALRRLEAAQPQPPKRTGRRPAPPAPPVPAPAPAVKALPPDLDHAQRQVYQGAAPTPAPRADGAP